MYQEVRYFLLVTRYVACMVELVYPDIMMMNKIIYKTLHINM